MVLVYFLFMIAGLVAWGRLIPKPADLDPVESIGFTLGLGWAAAGFVLYLAGFLHLYYVPTVLIVFFLPLAVWLYRLRFRGWKQEFATPLREALSILKDELGTVLFYSGIILFGGLTLILVLSAAGVDIAIDRYHVFLPAAFLRYHRIVSFPGDLVSTYPKLWEMTYLAASIFQSQTLPAMLNVFQWAVVGFVVFLFGRCLYSSKTGFLAAGFTLLTPWCLNVATMAHNDYAAIITSILAFYAMARYIRGGGQKWVIWVGLLSGLTLLSKLGAAFYYFPVFAVFLVFTILFRRDVKTVFLACLLGAAVSAPWWMNNLVQLGNPVYPALYKLMPKEEPFHFAAARCERKHGPSFKLFKRPSLLTVRRMISRTCIDGEGPSFLYYLLLLPWLAMCLFPGKGKKRDGIGVALALVAMMNCVFLVTTRGHIRLILIARPVINLVPAACILLLLKRLKREKLADPLILLFFGFMLFLGTAYLKNYRGFVFFPKSPLTVFSGEGVPGESEAGGVNEHTGEDDIILCDAELYYRNLERRFVPQHFLQFRYGNVNAYRYEYDRGKNRDGEGFGSYLTRRGITHIYTEYLDPAWELDRADPVFSWENRTLYRLEK